MDDRRDPVLVERARARAMKQVLYTHACMCIYVRFSGLGV